MAHAGEDLVDAFDASLDDDGRDDRTNPSHRRPRVLNPPAPCNFRVSLVGLPNSGKSCIFNILTGRPMSQEDVSLFSTAGSIAPYIVYTIIYPHYVSCTS